MCPRPGPVRGVDTLLFVVFFPYLSSTGVDWPQIPLLFILLHPPDSSECSLRRRSSRAGSKSGVTLSDRLSTSSPAEVIPGPPRPPSSTLPPRYRPEWEADDPPGPEAPSVVEGDVTHPRPSSGSVGERSGGTVGLRPQGILSRNRDTCRALLKGAAPRQSTGLPLRISSPPGYDPKVGRRVCPRPVKSEESVVRPGRHCDRV